MTAADGDDIELLVAALQQASMLCVGNEALEAAKKKLNELQEEARKRSEAEDALTKATLEEDIDALITSIAHAEEVGVDKSVVGEATTKLAALQERARKLQEAQDSLAQKLQGHDIPALEIAIACATYAGV